MNYWDQVVGMEKLSDGKIMLIVEGKVNRCNATLSAHRLTPEGLPDANFGTQGEVSKSFNNHYCISYEYDDYFAYNRLAVTETDDVLAIMSSPGYANSNYAGDIPVLISPDGDIKVHDTKTDCVSMVNVSGSYSMLCGSEVGRVFEPRTHTLYGFERFQFSDTNEELETFIDVSSLLDGLDYDTEQPLSYYVEGMTSDNAGNAFALFSAYQSTTIDGESQRTLDERLLIGLDDQNNLINDAFGDSRVTLAEQPLLAQAKHISLQPDNSFLFLGDGVIFKLNADGTLDNAYGTDGQYEYTVEEGSDIEWLHDAASQQVFIVQTGDRTLSVTAVTSEGATNTDFANNGILQFSLTNLNSELSAPHANSRVTKNAALDDALRIAVASNLDVGEIQVTKIGNTDENFGDNGFASKDLSEEGERLKTIYVDSDASLVLTEAGLFKYTATGELDTQFAQAGRYLFGFQADEAKWLDVQRLSDGRILLIAEIQNYELVLTQLLETGELDNSYGENGQKTLPLGEDGLDIFKSYPSVPEISEIYASTRSSISLNYQHSLILSDNILSVNLAVLEQTPNEEYPEYDIERGCTYQINITSEGELNTTFADSGVLRICADQWEEWGNPTSVPLAQYTQSESSLMVLSEEYFEVDVHDYIANGLTLMKVNTDGSVDASFGNNGVVRHDYRELVSHPEYPTYQAYSNDVLGSALQPDGKLLFAVQFGERPFGQAIFRFNTDGNLDPTFADNGVFWLDTLENSPFESQYVDVNHFTMQHDQIYLSGEYQGNAVVINLTEQNLAPVITAESVTAITLDEDTFADAITIVATDGNNDGLQWNVSTHPLHGSLSIETNGNTVNLEYTPQENFHGSDEFEVRVQDWRGAETFHSIAINVNAVNDAPTIALSSDNEVVSSGDEVSLTALTTDIDEDALSVSWSQLSGPTVDLSSSSDNQVSFVAPQVSTSTQIVFSATVSDGTLESTETLTITVQEPTQSPVDNDSSGSSGGAFYPLWLVMLVLIRRHSLRRHP